MTGVFEVLAADETDVRLTTRKALLLAEKRIEERLGKWLRTATTGSQYDSFLAYAKDEFEGIVREACEEVGHSQPDNIIKSLASHFRPFAPKTAAVHMARKPKMCPYHSEVVDISLSSGDPQAGYNVMSGHAWGPQHCQSDGYEGKCNFKRDMVTKSFWDDRQKALDERREQHRDLPQELFDTEAPVTEVTTEIPIDTIEPTDVAPITETFDAPAQIEAPVSEFTMAMASRISHVTPLVKEEGDSSPDGDSATPKGRTSKEDPSSQTDEGKKVPCPVCGGNGKSSSGKECSRCQGAGKVNDWGPSNLDKVAAEDNTGLGGPEPKMDKTKWTPQNVKEIPDDSKYNPTKRKDPIEPIIAENADNLTEIGEKTTERVDLPSGDNETGFFDGGETKAPSTKTFPKGTHEVDPVTSADLGYGQYPGDNDDQRAYDHWQQTGEKATLSDESHGMRNCPACMGQGDYHVATGEIGGDHGYDALIDPNEYQPIHHGKTADGGASYPPQADMQQSVPAQPYNPQAVEQSLGLEDEHPAVKYAYERAIQQGAHPQDALQNARAIQQQMGQQAVNGVQQPQQVPYMSKADDVGSNPIVDLMETDYDGFVPADTVSRVTSALRK